MPPILQEIFLARHGETEWNLAGRRQGQLDAPLTAAGIEEIERMADRLQPFPIDGVFSSPLGRAMATAQIYAEAFGLAVVIVDELAEIHHGAMAGLNSEQIEASFPGELYRRAADKYRWQFPAERATPMEMSERPPHCAWSRLRAAPGRWSWHTR